MDTHPRHPLAVCMPARRAACATLCLFTLCVSLPGCLAGPGPKLFPAAPIEVRATDAGFTERWYDVNGDGALDYVETLSPEGRLTRIGYGDGRNGAVETIDLDAIPPAEQKHLLLLLDSVPFDLSVEAWRHGRFRYCAPPSCLISPFPVMTDLSFSEFAGVCPCPGIESEYFDGTKLTSGYEVYAAGGNVPWQRDVDYRLNPVLHAQAYLSPYPWLDHELRQIQNLYRQRAEPLTTGYVVGTSSVGATLARNGHAVALVRVDRMCQQILYETRGRARFTLLSDHGHRFGDSKRISIRDNLRAMGYRVGSRLRDPGDVVVPEFGMVSCVAIHTHSAARVARDAVTIEGVEIAAYMDDGEMIVLSRDGQARVRRGPAGFAYLPESADPLELAPVLERLRADGLIDAEGFVADEALFQATARAAFPDAVYRLWRAFHGLVEHTPDVLLSLADGYHAGSGLQDKMIDLIGVHGSLRPDSTYGFMMSTTELPPILRMEQARAALRDIGVPLAERTEYAGW